MTIAKFSLCCHPEAATAKWRGAVNGGKGGFLVKFYGKEVERCYAVAFEGSTGSPSILSK